MKRQSINLIISTLLFAIALPLIGTSRARLNADSVAVTVDDSQPPLYLPEQRYVRLVTLGFDSFASDVLWFSTINYFGKQYRGNRDYRWLNQMCNLVTDLDPQALHVYEFCASMLTWEAKDIEKSDLILTKGLAKHPADWRLWYLRGFNAWYFAEDLVKAKADLEKAASLPEAPEFLASLASRMMVATNAPDTAVRFLSDMVARTGDPRAKEALQDKLKRAYLARDLAFLQEAIRRFELKHARLPQDLKELVSGAIITTVPVEPFGGQYELTDHGKDVRTSSGETPLTFHGKNAKTGIAKGDF